jgi:hypothetical protein
LQEINVKRNKPESEKQISHCLSYMESKIKKKKDMNVKGRLFGGGPVGGAKTKQ